MKKRHLICNAHLDPVWLWRWNEGLAETISTFRVAADFCEKEDQFVFNHNEAVLYEWVEEYDPALFQRIRRLVDEGKWHIMGGWYLQPDCVMTSGESLLSQIALGREYFQEKFGVTPTTSINFDSFGHSRGLVQILRVTGYDSYIFTRPPWYEGDFVWEGFDGSQVLAKCCSEGYGTLRGQAAKRIQGQMGKQTQPVDLSLWGIGNHGGGPSKVDLAEVNAYIAETEDEILHSTPEQYFKEIDATTLPVKKESLIAVMVGCYTSMVRIKQAHRLLENKIAVAEKAMTYAQWSGGLDFNQEELKEAKKDLAFCQFHDILPGSGVRPVEEDALQRMAHGTEIAEKLFQRAFFTLCEGQEKAEEGTIPVMVFNPHPYEIEGEFEIDFILADQNWNEDEETLATVYDEQGNELPTQNEMPNCTFNLDWPKKVSFRAKVAPAGITRFNCRLQVFKKADLPQREQSERYIRVKNDRMELVIDRQSGLIDRYVVDGKLLAKQSGLLEVYRDNEDPWGMTVKSFLDLEGTFRLMSDEKANSFTGYPDSNTPNVRVVEDGEVRLKVQSFWEYEGSKAVLEYLIPKQGTHVDVELTVYFTEPNKMLRYRLDCGFEGTPWGQTAFGSEELYDDGREVVFQRWCALRGQDQGLAILNRGTYGGYFTKDSVRMSLLRTPVYACHPIYDRPRAPHDRCLEHIDMGQRRFSLRITTTEDLERKAQIYNEAPSSLSFFPSGEGEAQGRFLEMDGQDVILSSLRRNKDKNQVTLFNTCPEERQVTLRRAGGKEPVSVTLRGFELKIMELE